jgi:hypothetical protein
MLGVYELNRIELLRDVFIWSYERSAARYAAVRQSLGEPDPFRLQYREALRSVVGEVVRGGMDRRAAAEHVAAWVAANVEQDDQEKFREVAEKELLGLHEGNFARYAIRPGEFAACVISGRQRKSAKCEYQRTTGKDGATEPHGLLLAAAGARFRCLEAFPLGARSGPRQYFVVSRSTIASRRARSRFGSSGRNLGRPKIICLAQELQPDLRGFEHCTCALHREVQRLQAIDAKHVLGSSPNAVQPCDLHSAPQSEPGTGCGTPIVSTTDFPLAEWNTRRAAIRRIVRGRSEGFVHTTERDRIRQVRIPQRFIRGSTPLRYDRLRGA